MPISLDEIKSVLSGDHQQRVESLRQLLGYPLKERDLEGSRFWFLRPGEDEEEAADTCPIAVGFYAELDRFSRDEILQFLTGDEQQKEIYGHYAQRIIPNQPVMYLLLPEGKGGLVAMILPTEGKLRQRQIQTFALDDEDLRARLNRLTQDSLERTNRIKDLALSIIPLVEWAFYVEEVTRKLCFSPTPENILGYIYAILHSPTYRERYTDFLRGDFPHIPLTSNSQQFESLATYGEELVALHLMKSSKLNDFITEFENNSDCVVDSGYPKYKNGKIFINKRGDAFIGVPEEVWNFYIGGYQVCQKWLKDRKGRTLSPEDITHYQRIIVALQETIRLMQKIDAAIPVWPIE
jgi:Type ISP C-terminal specificity domain